MGANLTSKSRVSRWVSETSNPDVLFFKSVQRVTWAPRFMRQNPVIPGKRQCMLLGSNWKCFGRASERILLKDTPFNSGLG